MNFHDPQYFLNRELSWLEFNQRVLEEALTPENPLLERLKFLCIVSSNLDEFFEIRVAGLQQQKQNASLVTGADGLSASSQLKAISERTRKLVGDQYRCWREDLVPALAEKGIRFLTYPDVSSADRAYVQDYFQNEVYPVLTPLAIDPVHPFPQLLNKSLNVVVELEAPKGDERLKLAVVQVPRILPRLVPLPREDGTYDFIFIGHVIQHHVGSLFHGMRVLSSHLFRVTRNSDLYIDEEESENLLRMIEQELRHRSRGNAVRLETQMDCPESVVNRLLDIFHLEKADLYKVDGPINFIRLFPVIAQIDRPDLKFKPFVAPVIPALRAHPDLFAAIRKQDLLLHHPYESFQTVVDFVGLAAEDPKVLAIKQTLYRTSGDSPIVASLIEAAQNGKQVTAVVEIKARFDEAANIKWARVMQEAGVHVVYGLVGLKTHAKLSMVVRRDEDGIRRYVHLGTGNYHPSTAKLYTDLGLLTCREEIGSDCAELFNLLTGVSEFPGMQKLLVAHWTLHKEMCRLIRAEADHHKAGRPAGIRLKLNSLVDEEVITALYEASSAGVPIELTVRGICCLRPGVKGVSENIKVRSIVGRFLEHSRIYRFENGGSPLLYLASADWMPRNFYRRVETCFPLDDPAICKRVEDQLDLEAKDNVKARELQSDGSYVRKKIRAKAERIHAQEIFLADAQRIAKEADAAAAAAVVENLPVKG